jgi:hypothetical protein
MIFFIVFSSIIRVNKTKLNKKHMDSKNIIIKLIKMIQNDG